MGLLCGRMALRGGGDACIDGTTSAGRVEGNNRNKLYNDDTSDDHVDFVQDKNNDKPLSDAFLVIRPSPVR